MIVLSNYLSFLLRPVKTHEEYGEKGLAEADHNSLWESLSVSWIFFICQAIYGILFLVFGHQYIMSEWDFGDYGFDIGVDAFSLFKSDLLASIFAVVSFPLFVFYICKLWAVAIKFAAKIFERKDITKERIDLVVASALSSHALYLIPFIGGFLKNIWYIVILYAGLRKNLKFSQTQSIFTIFLPAVILCLLGMLLTGILYLQLQAVIKLLPEF